MNAQFDPNKQKAVPLNANVPAVKSPNLPAKRKREFRDFDDFVKTAEALVCRADSVLPQFGSSDLKAEYLLDYGSRLMLEEFFSGVDFYSRPELYRQRKRELPDLRNVHTTRQITQRTVSEQVGLLIGSFPNGTPNSPEVYSKMLIEEIVAANPSAIVLERPAARSGALASFCQPSRKFSAFYMTKQNGGQLPGSGFAILKSESMKSTASKQSNAKHRHKA
jgi:hypothetical protein